MQGSDFKTLNALQEISKTENISERERHLIGLAVTITKGCTDCTSGRFKDAIKAGINHQTLVDLSDLVAITNAGVAIRTVLTGSEKANLDEICKDDICKA